jgi:hypothetical protein
MPGLPEAFLTPKRVLPAGGRRADEARPSPLRVHHGLQSLIRIACDEAEQADHALEARVEHHFRRFDGGARGDPSIACGGEIELTNRAADSLFHIARENVIAYAHDALEAGAHVSRGFVEQRTKAFVAFGRVLGDPLGEHQIPDIEIGMRFHVARFAPGELHEVGFPEVAFEAQHEKRFEVDLECVGRETDLLRATFQNRAHQQPFTFFV